MTTISQRPKTNQEVIPHVRADVFSDEPESRFALGVFDGSDVVTDHPSPLIQAYLRLRANVYIDQIGVLENDHRRQDGTEIDDDDERSTHLVLVENLVGKVAVFGCMRLIEKSEARPNALPIEKFYPNSFETAASIGATEVSRFIVRHDEARQRFQAKVNLIHAGLAYTVNNKLTPVFATVEEQLDRDLHTVGVPTTQVSEPQFIEEYNTVNLGVEIDTKRMKKVTGARALNNLSVGKGTFGAYWGTVDTYKVSQESE